jgi:hypothetical protein
MRMARKEQLKMASELGPHIEVQDTSTDVKDTLGDVQADDRPITYEQDPARAEAMAYAENPRRERAQEFMKVALKAADNIEAGNTQPVSHKQEYEWDPPFSDYKTEWHGLEGSYEESDKPALAAIAREHPNMERFSGDYPAAKENFKVELSHEEIADAAIEHAQTQIELASSDAEWVGAKYDEQQQEAAAKASDVRSRIAQLK